MIMMAAIYEMSISFNVTRAKRKALYTFVHIDF